MVTFKEKATGIILHASTDSTIAEMRARKDLYEEVKEEKLIKETK